MTRGSLHHMMPGVAQPCIPLLRALRETLARVSPRWLGQTVLGPLQYFVAVAPSGEEVQRSRLLQAPAQVAARVRFSEFALRCWGLTATTRGHIVVETAGEVIEQRYFRLPDLFGVRFG